MRGKDTVVLYGNQVSESLEKGLININQMEGDQKDSL